MSEGNEATLTAADASAFAALLRAEALLGPAQPSPGEAEFWGFLAAVDSIAYDRYQHITNPLVLGWANKVFGALVGTPTSYGFSAAGLYALYCYTQFTACCFPGNSTWPADACGQQGFPAGFAQRGGREPTYSLDKGLGSASPWNWFASAVGLWKPPGSPGSFFDELNHVVDVINDALHAAGQATAAVALFVGGQGTSPDSAAVQAFERTRVDPKNWTDSATFVKNLAATGIWREQSQQVTALLQPATLTADAYFLLLHLLIALGTSTPADQRLAQNVVTAIATSPEYPNDTFGNQLVYLSLMHLNDPMGPFGWSNAQLLDEMALLGGLIASPDPASQALRTSLDNHRRLLQSDTAYPMQDPYSPSVGFPQRLTDTLFALDRARQTLRH